MEPTQVGDRIKKLPNEEIQNLKLFKHYFISFLISYNLPNLTISDGEFAL